MPITLDGHSLTIEDVVAIARKREKIQLHPEALRRIRRCRDAGTQDQGARDHVWRQYRHW
jgi:histidine ammonia-lyase